MEILTILSVVSTKKPYSALIPLGKRLNLLDRTLLPEASSSSLLVATAGSVPARHSRAPRCIPLLFRPASAIDMPHASWRFSQKSRQLNRAYARLPGFPNRRSSIFLNAQARFQVLRPGPSTESGGDGSSCC